MNIKQLMIASVVTTSFISSAAYAKSQTYTQELNERQHYEEAVGLGTGVVVGAIVGGPIGAFIGGFTGALIGQSEGDKSEIKQQGAYLSHQQQMIAGLRQQLNEQDLLARKAEQLTQELNRVQSQLLQNTLAMTIQFRTGKYEIEPHFARQLNELAKMLKRTPELELDLAGFADKRGDKAFNLQLSKDRVAQVKSYLIKQGVDHTRLFSQAFGIEHAVAKQQDFEGNFFDRRVMLKVRNKDMAVASNF